MWRLFESEMEGLHVPLRLERILQTKAFQKNLLHKLRRARWSRQTRGLLFLFTEMFALWKVFFLARTTAMHCVSIRSCTEMFYGCLDMFSFQCHVWIPRRASVDVGDLSERTDPLTCCSSAPGNIPKKPEYLRR